MPMTISVDSTLARRKLKRLVGEISDWTPALSRWARLTGIDYREEWGEMTFRALYPTGKMFRGVYWRGVRPLYFRKDGPVPPWGGVKKVQRSKPFGKLKASGRVSVKPSGLVLGRKRPSGARVSPGDIVGQDTAKMARELTSRYVIAANKRRVSMYAVVKYAKYQNMLRPLDNLGRKDIERLNLAVQWQIDAAIGGAMQ
jgi:hypothetical protein